MGSDWSGNIQQPMKFSNTDTARPWRNIPQWQIIISEEKNCSHRGEIRSVTFVHKIRTVAYKSAQLIVHVCAHSGAS